jgi:hypothetical protein
VVGVGQRVRVRERAVTSRSTAHHPFDFADYVVFSTKWEDAISGL